MIGFADFNRLRPARGSRGVGSTASSEMYCYAGAWALPVPLIVTDGSLVVFANAALLRLLGRDDIWEVLGRDVDGIIHPDVRLAAATRRELLSRSDEPLDSVPTKLLSRDGRPIPVEAALSPVTVSGSRLTLIEVLSQRPSGWTGRVPAPPSIGCMALSGERYSTSSQLLSQSRTTRRSSS